MVYTIEKFFKIVASLSRLPRPKIKNAENSIFLLYVLKKSSKMWFETHLMLRIAQLTLEINFWKYILSFETWWLFLGFCLAYWNKEKRRAKKAQKYSKDERELTFLTLNQEQINKVRIPINIRANTK